MTSQRPIHTRKRRRSIAKLAAFAVAGLLATLPFASKAQASMADVAVAAHHDVLDATIKSHLKVLEATASVAHSDSDTAAKMRFGLSLRAFVQHYRDGSYQANAVYRDYMNLPADQLEKIMTAGQVELNNNKIVPAYFQDGYIHMEDAPPVVATKPHNREDHKSEPKGVQKPAVLKSSVASATEELSVSPRQVTNSKMPVTEVKAHSKAADLFFALLAPKPDVLQPPHHEGYFERDISNVAPVSAKDIFTGLAAPKNESDFSPPLLKSDFSPLETPAQKAAVALILNSPAAKPAPVVALPPTPQVIKGALPDPVVNAAALHNPAIIAKIPAYKDRGQAPEHVVLAPAPNPIAGGPVATVPKDAIVAKPPVDVQKPGAVVVAPKASAAIPKIAETEPYGLTKEQFESLPKKTKKLASSANPKIVLRFLKDASAELFKKPETYEAGKQLIDKALMVAKERHIENTVVAMEIRDRSVVDLQEQHQDAKAKQLYEKYTALIKAGHSKDVIDGKVAASVKQTDIGAKFSLASYEVGGMSVEDAAYRTVLKTLLNAGVRERRETFVDRVRRMFSSPAYA